MGYLKDMKTGEVYLETDNPIYHWTRDEWEQYLKDLRAERDRLLSSAEQVIVVPKDLELPPEIMGLVEVHNANIEDRPGSQLAIVLAELAAAEAVE